MVCRHLHVETSVIRSLGEPPSRHDTPYCRLKQASPQNRLAMCDEHARRWIGGSIEDDLCPVAGSQQWTACRWADVPNK